MFRNFTYIKLAGQIEYLFAILDTDSTIELNGTSILCCISQDRIECFNMGEMRDEYPKSKFEFGNLYDILATNSSVRATKVSEYKYLAECNAYNKNKRKYINEKIVDLFSTEYPGIAFSCSSKIPNINMHSAKDIYSIMTQEKPAKLSFIKKLAKLFKL